MEDKKKKTQTKSTRNTKNKTQTKSTKSNEIKNKTNSTRNTQERNLKNKKVEDKKVIKTDDKEIDEIELLELIDEKKDSLKELSTHIKEIDDEDISFSKEDQEFLEKMKDVFDEEDNNKLNKHREVPTKKKLKLKKINIISIISLITTFIMLILLFKLGIIPILYLFLVTILVLVVNVVGFLMINSKKKVLKIIGIIILILSIIISLIGSYFVYGGERLLDKSFNNKFIKYSNTYYVVSYKDSNYRESDIQNDVSYYENSRDIKKAIKKLEKDFDVKMTASDDMLALFTDLKDKKINFVLIEKTSYNILFELTKNVKEEDYEIIYKFDITGKTKVSAKDNGDSFSMYIGGTDFAGLMDFNMLVTVNMRSNKILLTSIPRDYYMEVDGFGGKKDTLSYMSAYGIDTNRKSLAKFFDTDVDYYVKINTHSLVGMVDAVGGINFCSDMSFTTTHALVLDTYDDRKGKKLYVQEGCQHLNGIETLTVARERNALPGRDRARQANCRKIIIAIFDQLKSTNTVTNYGQIIDSLGELYETTLPKDIIQRVMKDTVNGANWKFEQQAVNGEDTKDYVHMTNMVDWVMYPDMKTVNKAKKKIKKVLK